MFDQIFYVETWAIKEGKVEECRRLMVELEELIRRKPELLPKGVKFVASYFTMGWTGGGHTCEAWFEMENWGSVDKFREGDWYHMLKHRRFRLINYSLPHTLRILRRPHDFTAWWEAKEQLFLKDEIPWSKATLEVNESPGEE